MICPGFSILPKHMAYAVPYEDWWKLYLSDHSPAIRRMLSRSFAMHYWSAMDKLSQMKPRILDAKQPIYEVFARNCPVTERLELRSHLGESF